MCDVIGGSKQDWVLSSPGGSVGTSTSLEDEEKYYTTSRKYDFVGKKEGKVDGNG